MGDEAYEAMKELKAIFDPDGLLNQGVIFNDDPDCFIKCLKPLPVLDYDFDSVPDGGHYLMEPEHSTAHETIEMVKRANKCIECGFCEVNCMSCGLTLSSRSVRSVSWRPQAEIPSVQPPCVNSISTMAIRPALLMDSVPPPVR